MKHFKLSALVGIVFLLCAFIAASDVSAYTITSITLSGPSRIPCPPDGCTGTYTISLTGTGQSQTIASWLNYAVYDNDFDNDSDMPWYDTDIDDMLKNEEVFSILGDEEGNWTWSDQFDLECADGCKVKGPYGTSSETTAEVYVLIENSIGSNLGVSNTLNVTCSNVPIPPAALLFVTGLFGLAGFNRTKRPRN